MDETQTIEAAPPVASEPSAAATPAPAQAAPDPFAVDEGMMATLSPESRTAAEATLKSWKENAQKHLEERTKSAEEFSKKAQALDRLVQDQKFVQWYQKTYGPNAGKEEPAPKSPSQDQYQPSNDELMQAANDPVKYANLMEKMLDAKYQQKFNELDTKNKSIELSMEFESVTRRHPDFWDLDKSGVMEPLIHYFKDVRKMGIEDAYQHAKKIEEFFTKKTKGAMQGVVTDRKASVVEGTSTSSAEGTGVIFASNPQDMLRLQLMENMPGGLKRKVALRK